MKKSNFKGAPRSGGLTGNIRVGIVRDSQMVRVGADGCDEDLAETHVKPIDFTGRALRSRLFAE